MGRGPGARGGGIPFRPQRRKGAIAIATRTLLLSVFLLSSFATCFIFACVKSPVLPWNGEYSGVSEGSEARTAALIIQEARKGTFLFSLALSKENGYTWEIAGGASFKGREARHSGEGYELTFTLGEGEEPPVILGVSGTMMDTEGLAARIYLERRVAEKVQERPEDSATPAGTGEFRFGYYLPEGALGEALPESLVFVFFDREGMKAREIRMFEGMTDEGREIGSFSLDGDAIRLSSKDLKSGKNIERIWKREEGGAVVSDSGQRYFFWKGNLEE